MIELFVNCAVVAVIAVPVLIVMYLVKFAGEEAIRDHIENLYKIQKESKNEP